MDLSRRAQDWISPAPLGTRMARGLYAMQSPSSTGQPLTRHQIHSAAVGDGQFGQAAERLSASDDAVITSISAAAVGASRPQVPPCPTPEIMQLSEPAKAATAAAAATGSSESAAGAADGGLSARLSHLSLLAHADLLERCAAERLLVPCEAMSTWGTALEMALRRHQEEEQHREEQRQWQQREPEDGELHRQLDQDSLAAGCIPRILVAISRLGRRPPHSTMNALLAASLPHLGGMSTKRLAACMGALSRMR